jgi:hypothetical protein
MSINETFIDFYPKGAENQVILAYEGELNPEITSSVINLAEKNLDRRLQQLPVRRKAFHIAVECLQNISAHSEKDNRKNNSIFLICQNESGYLISSGNVIKAEKVPSLQQKIDQINNLDQEGLKQLHMQAIKESLQKPECSNAGLGLISIARKSGRKIEYQFVRMDKENTFFSIKASIPSGD